MKIEIILPDDKRLKDVNASYSPIPEVGKLEFGLLHIPPKKNLSYYSPVYGQLSLIHIGNSLFQTSVMEVNVYADRFVVVRFMGSDSFDIFSGMSKSNPNPITVQEKLFYNYIETGCNVETLINYIQLTHL